MIEISNPNQKEFTYILILLLLFTVYICIKYIGISDLKFYIFSNKPRPNSRKPISIIAIQTLSPF